MIVLDASVLYALMDRRDTRHAEALGWYEAAEDEMGMTPLVLAEVDHLVRARAAPEAVRAFRSDLAAGAYVVDWWAAAAAESAKIAERYPELALSLADASLAALAARYHTVAIATFDERHFRVVRPLTGEPAFRLLPLDA